MLEKYKENVWRWFIHVCSRGRRGKQLIFNIWDIDIKPLQTYSEWETEEAMKFIKENDLPMSDMFYALKYVRISNRAVELDEQFQQIQDRLDKLRQEDIRMVSPPSGGDWDPKLNK